MKDKINKILKVFGQKLVKIDRDPFKKSGYKRNFEEKSLHERRFYNVGAGNFYHPYWTNIDYISDWYKGNSKYTNQGIHYNLFSLSPLPLEDNMAEILYTSHTIEHIKDQHAMNLFKEAFRVLKKGGIFRITAPDMDLHYNAYMKNDIDFFYWKDWYAKKNDYERIGLNAPLSTASIHQLFLQKLATAATILHIDGVKNRITDEEMQKIFSTRKKENAFDYCCNQCPLEIQKKYPGNHTNWWNREKAVRFLKEAGFEDIVISGYGQSSTPVLRNTLLFDTTHPQTSFYIEASK